MRDIEWDGWVIEANKELYGPQGEEGENADE
jgi:hypothetical protein